MIDDKARYPRGSDLATHCAERGRHHRFRQKMAEAGFTLGQVTTSHPGYVPKFELNFWIGVNGKVFITQVWEGGGYEVYYPTEYHQVDECEAEAVRFGTEKETPARELYTALKRLMDALDDAAEDDGQECEHAYAMLQKHLGLTSQKP